ncbi:MAG TPA: hypothetical protein VJV78_38060 [Polyangiales bacterium]|nr:hypothetical protein [Polyangiales bacterium]
MAIQFRVLIGVLCIIGLMACAADSGGDDSMSGDRAVVTTPSTSNAGSGASAARSPARSVSSPMSPAAPSGAPAAPPAAPVTPAPMTTPPRPGMQPPPPAMTPNPTPPTVAPPPAPSGDPNGSGGVVSIPDTKCGPAAGLDAFVAGTGIPGPGTPNVKIGGRDVVLSYPCDVHEGAHVTFILNLHGTMPDETLKTYQHGYFSAHKYVTSHKLIVATPISKSPVGQWGNMDGGVDVPHLYEVIKWVYEKFGKLQITGMWVGGHSWGSAFAKTFVCDAMLKDKVRGVIGMSGGATAAAGGDCAARISQIHTVGEMEGGEGGVPNQTAIAAAHGCDGMLPKKDIGNGQMLYDWPNCDKGWVHFNFVMGNHEHITAMDDPVVKYIVDAIKSTEK